MYYLLLFLRVHALAFAVCVYKLASPLVIQWKHARIQCRGYSSI